MAQLIIIPEHTVNITDLRNSIPGGNFKKLFFQCALREIVNNGGNQEAHFSIIVYAAKHKPFSQKWKPGTKVDCTPVAGGKTAVFDLADYSEPIGFANNEFTDLNLTLKKMKGKDKNTQQQDKIMNTIQKLLKDKKNAKNYFLSFEAKISKNPHVTYTVTLSDGTSANANPSPPADPS